MSRVVAEGSGLDAAAEALLAGCPIVVPTDTVYGLAVRASDLTALEKLFELKNRPTERRVAVLVSDIEQAEKLVELPTPVRRVADRFWPGPLTVVARALTAVDPSDPTLGVRCPDHDFIRELAARVGPLATTSANRHGEPTPTSAGSVAEALSTVELVIDGGICSGVPSTVVDFTGSTPTVLRVGSVTAAMIDEAWVAST